MNEKTILNGKLSKSIFIIRQILNLLLLMLFIELGIYTFIFIIWLIKDLITYFNTSLIITTKRIKGKAGLFNVRELNSPLNKITGIEVKQSFTERLLKCGNIIIVTASTKFEYKYIDKPFEFKETLYKQIEKYEDSRMEEQAKKINYFKNIQDN